MLKERSKKVAALGKIIDISPVLHKALNRIALVGVELEGGWDKLPKGTSPVHDGSVRFPDQMINIVGELPLPPEPVNEFPARMQAYFPHHVNETCGMHVHMSFRTALSYQRLMTPDYPATVIEFINRWAKKEKLDKYHPLWPRLNGMSEYCQHKFHATEQAGRTNKDHERRAEGSRYTVINYCYSRHSTIECRLLPMMANYELSLRAVNEVLAITNAFLSLASKKSEPKVRSKHVCDEDGIHEYRRIVV
jgi:hypothetical protein